MSDPDQLLFIHEEDQHFIQDYEEIDACDLGQYSIRGYPVGIAKIEENVIIVLITPGLPKKVSEQALREFCAKWYNMRNSEVKYL